MANLIVESLGIETTRSVVQAVFAAASVGIRTNIANDVVNDSIETAVMSEDPILALADLERDWEKMIVDELERSRQIRASLTG